MMTAEVSFSFGEYQSFNSVEASAKLVEAHKWQRLSENGDGINQSLGLGSHSGKRVTHNTALQLAAFWACVRVNAQALACMPLQVFEKQRNGSREPISDHELADLLVISPNQDQTPLEFWESNVAWMLTQGNSYCEKRFIGDRLVALEPLSHLGCKPKRNSDGVLEYRFNDRGKSVVLPRSRVFHLKGFGLGGDEGLSVVRNGVQTLGTSIATEESAGKIFGNGLHSSGILSSEQTLDVEQRKKLGKVMQQYVGSTNAGKLMILEAGLKYNQITLNPEDAQMLETRKFNTEEICRWFGTPPIIIGHSADGQTMWGSGVEQIVLAWLTLGLNPVATKIEQRILKQLLSRSDRRRIYAEYNRESLLQMDSNSKQRFLASLVNNGLMSRNEGREKLNLPRREGADDLTVQTALAPLDQLAAVIANQQS